MTKETKIGLLVGLAFIILFAIILSEKGTPQRSSTLPTFTVADGAKSVSPLAGSDQPLGSAGRFPVTSKLPPIVQPKPSSIAVGPVSPVIMEEERVAQVEPKKEEPVAALPESVVDFLNNMPIKNDPALNPTLKSESVASSNPPAIAIPPTVGSAVKSPIVKPETTSPTISNETANAMMASRELAKPAPEKPAVIRTVHTVQPGESLGKIAAKYYGRSTPARVDAIFKANRERLKDTHQVKAQQKLDIPDLGEANSAFEPVSVLALSDPGPIRSAPRTSESIRIPVPIRESTASMESSLKKLSPPDGRPPTIQTASMTTPPRKNKPAEASYQWYEVRPKDTLSKIAKIMLGSEKHSSELYKLNKDRMANKNNLKPGMKLRIPVKSAASLEPQTAVSSNGFGDAD